jgi:SAM-dependent methyltransferase
MRIGSGDIENTLREPSVSAPLEQTPDKVGAGLSALFRHVQHVTDRQHQVDDNNRAFWDELCGTLFARSLGITTLDAESLRRFDEAYLAYYPYLDRYVDADLHGHKVLEIGLGFGTLGQLLASRGAEYYGVDIAENPVALMRERLRRLSAADPLRVVQGSALALPFDDGTFDDVYSIGCLHHTGDLVRAVSEVRRVLRPDGRAVVMLYNRHSLRHVLKAGLRSLRRLDGNGDGSADERLRGLYDSDTLGEAAPHTDFVSRAEARRLFRSFTKVTIDTRNFDVVSLNLKKRSPAMARVLGHDGVGLPRALFLGNLDRLVGLDLYIRAVR